MKTAELDPKHLPMLATHKLHGALLRLLYKVVSPTHPRGWLDFHCVIENENTNWIHCHGMTRWKLHNLEIVGVPNDLRGYAHGIMFDIAGYMKQQRPIAPDESFGGLLVDEKQIVPHQCTLRLVQQDEEPVDKQFLRIVDHNEPKESGFPRKLFAAHLLALAETRSYRSKRVEMLRRSVEIYPGEANAGPDDENAAAQNPGNFFSWYSLGDALCDAGQTEEGLKRLRESVVRWPFGARKNAKVIVDAIAQGRLPPAEEDPRSRFWTELLNTP